MGRFKDTLGPTQEAVHWAIFLGFMGGYTPTTPVFVDILGKGTRP